MKYFLSIKELFRNNFTAYQFFQISRLSAVILISIILVKSGYDQGQVSNFERFIFLANLFTFFWVMGFKNAFLSYYPKLDLTLQSKLFGDAFVILQTIGLFVAIIAYIGLGSEYFGSAISLMAEARLFLCIYVIFYAPTVLIEVFFILKEKNALMINYSIWIHLLQVVVIGFAAILGVSLQSIFLLLIAWMFIKWLYALRVIFRDTNLHISTSQMKKFILFSSPIILHILLGNGMEFIDGILVNRFFPSDQFAIFRYGARELPFVLILIGALSSTMIPVAVRDLKKAGKELKARSRKMMHWFYPLSILLLFTSPFLYKLFYSDTYLASASIFNIYLLIIASRIIMVEVLVYGTQQNKLLMWVSGMELILNLVLSILLLQVWGLKGIAYATVIAFMLSKIFFIIFIRIKNELRLRDYIPIKPYLIYNILMISSYILTLYI